jgi:hypothetical protein
MWRIKNWYTANDDEVEKKNVIVYSSRLDKEKNPFFMMR